MSKTQRGQRPDRHIPDGSGGRETCCRVGVKTSWSPESQDHLSILSEVTVLERVVSVIVTVTITECECDPLVTSGCHDVTLLSPGVLVITDLSPLSPASHDWARVTALCLSWWKAASQKVDSFCARNITEIWQIWKSLRLQRRGRGTEKQQEAPKVIECWAYQESPSRKLTNWKQFIWSIFATSTPVTRPSAWCQSKGFGFCKCILIYIISQF